MTQPPSPDQPPFGAPQPYGTPGEGTAGMPPQPPAYGAPPQPYGTPPQAYGAPAQPQAYSASPQGYGTPPEPPAYGAPPQPYGTPVQPQPYGAPPHPYGAPVQPQPYGAPVQPQTYGAPPRPQTYGAPPQPPAPPLHAYVGTPPGQAPPAGPGGVVQHGAYDRPPEVPRGSVLPSSRPPKRPSGWNGPAFGLLAIAVTLAGIILWPQARARKTEAAVKPLVAALAQRDAGARCPRYITSVLTNVGSVSLDETGRIADRTDLTGPVCDGLRHFYTPEGKAELSCLTTGSRCPDSALVSVVALSVVVHESMHLRGQLDEGRAECESIGESQTLATTLGIPLEQARMISWLHYAGMNPNTPPEYQITPEDCQFVAELQTSIPGTPEGREELARAVNRTWTELAS